MLSQSKLSHNTNSVISNTSALAVWYFILQCYDPIRNFYPYWHTGKFFCFFFIKLVFGDHNYSKIAVDRLCLKKRKINCSPHLTTIAYFTTCGVYLGPNASCKLTDWQAWYPHSKSDQCKWQWKFLSPNLTLWLMARLNKTHPVHHRSYPTVTQLLNDFSVFFSTRDAILYCPLLANQLSLHGRDVIAFKPINTHCREGNV